MTESSAANLELALVLPLGVVANQLLRIEADLRFLNMKALLIAKERERGTVGAQISVRLEQINEALDLIRRLTSDIETDMLPKSATVAAASSKDQTSRKPLPERDD
ncbi:MAG: hypothetical protein ABJD53_17655 [Gammaproteobacteria bacterium]